MLHQTNRLNQKYFLGLIAFLIISSAIKVLIFNQVYDLSPETVIRSDTIRYEAPALELLKTGTLAIAPQSEKTTTLSTTPVYSLYIAGIYKLFGINNHYALIISQILLSTLTIFILFLLAHRLWSRKTAIVVMLLMTIDPLQFLYSQLILSETLFTFFLSSSLLAITSMFFSPQKAKWALIFGIFFTLTTMTRPISYYLLFCIVIGLIIFKKRITRSWSQLFIIILLMLLPFLLTTTAWKLRNENLTGVYVLNDAMSETLLYYKAKGVLITKKSLTDDEAQQEILERLPKNFKTPKERADAETKLAKEIILGDMTSYFKLSLKGLKAIIFGPGLTSQAIFYDDKQRGKTSNNHYKPWYIILITYGIAFMLITYIFSAYGFLTALRDKSKPPYLVLHLLMLGTIFYFILISTGHTATDSRMRTPIIPIILLYASYGVISLLETVRSRKITKNKTNI